MKKSCISLMLCIALVCFGGCGKGKSERLDGKLGLEQRKQFLHDG